MRSFPPTARGRPPANVTSRRKATGETQRAADEASAPSAVCVGPPIWRHPRSFPAERRVRGAGELTFSTTVRTCNSTANRALKAVVAQSWRSKHLALKALKRGSTVHCSLLADFESDVSDLADQFDGGGAPSEQHTMLHMNFEGHRDSSPVNKLSGKRSRRH